jgi:hypothetical protein
MYDETLYIDIRLFYAFTGGDMLIAQLDMLYRK